MSDQRRIVEGLVRAAERRESVALVTVVGTVGPAYRRRGTRMVVSANGQSIGMVSAGCLERDVVLAAARALESGHAAVVTFDGRDEVELGWGAGCGGVLDLLVEPLTPDRAGRVAALLRVAVDGDQPYVIVTVVSSDGGGAPSPGARLLIAADGAVEDEEGAWGDGRLRAIAAADSRPPWSACGGNGALAVRDDLTGRTIRARMCIESTRPVVRLVICGSGVDAEPVCRLACSLGWNVTVLEHRPVAVSTPERFAPARVVECADASAVAERVRLTPHTAAIVMSHHMARDTAYLAALLGQRLAYVGVLGPRSRTTRMLADLADGDGQLMQRAAAVVHAPAGLDIGGEGAEAIALSIIAEVQAVMNRRSADAPTSRGHAVGDAAAESGPDRLPLRPPVTPATPIATVASRSA